MDDFDFLPSGGPHLNEMSLNRLIGAEWQVPDFVFARNMDPDPIPRVRGTSEGGQPWGRVSVGRAHRHHSTQCVLTDFHNAVPSTGPDGQRGIVNLKSDMNRSMEGSHQDHRTT